MREGGNTPTLAICNDVHYRATMNINAKRIWATAEGIGTGTLLPFVPVVDRGVLQAELGQSSLQRLESSSVVLDAYLQRAQIAVAGTKVEDSLRDTLLTWARPEKTATSQRLFWRFYRGIRQAEEYDLDVLITLPHELASSSLNCRVIGQASTGTDVLAKLAQLDLDRLYVVDGQHRCTFISGSLQLDLSQRAIRQIAGRLLAELEDISNTVSTSLLSIFRHSLESEVASKSTIRWTYVRSRPRHNTSPHTREWILAFLLRTGTPPPSTFSDRRPGADAVPVAFAQASQRLEHGTICRQYHRGNLLDAVRRRRGATPFSQGPQDCTSPARRPQLARCRRVWTDFQVAEFHGKIGSAGRRKVVPDVRLGGRRRRLRYPLGATVDFRGAYA